MGRVFLTLGALAGALAVLLGAFGAHGLKSRLSADLLAVYETGVLYHTVHALALVAVGIAAHFFADSSALRWSGWLFLIGIMLFSGSLYALALSGVRALGAITPFGGTAFVAGWVALAIAAWQS
jgi:uncharacterized membrane protein YgdD (TMEM256/DUF423 family)